MTFNFVISPPLPDDTSGVELVFKGFSTPFADKPIGTGFVI
ncbi:hypothetical protein [Bacillus pseudomycoides]|nr:hypothetical protein [Bacillus pseudomycoides]